MEAFSYENLDQLAQVIEVTFTGAGGNEQIKKAEKILNDMAAQDPYSFITALLKIINNEKNDDKVMRIKHAASIKMTQCVIELIKHQKLPDEHRATIVREVIKLMYGEHLPLQMKISLQYFLVLLYDSKNSLGLIQEAIELVKTKLSESVVGAYPPSFLIVQSILNTAVLTNEQVATTFQALDETLMNIGGFLTQNIIQDAKDLGNVQNQDKFNELFIKLKLLKMWLIVMHEFIKSLTERKLDGSNIYFKIITNHDQLVKIYVATQMIVIPTPRQVAECHVSTSGNQEIDQLIHGAKTAALHSFSRVIMHSNEFSSILDPSENKFFANAVLMTGFIINSLVNFAKTEHLNNERINSDRELSDLLTESLKFLSNMVTFPDLNNLFSSELKDLIMRLCLPLLMMNQAEMKIFHTNPDQFYTLALDTCTKQVANIPKVQAAKFLKEICSQMDGALSFTSAIVLCMIDYSMASDKPADIPSNYKDLADHMDSILIKSEAIARVETCLLVLCILYLPIRARKDILAMVEKLFIAYQEFFLGAKTHPLIKVRMCLLFPIYAHILFKGEEKKAIFASHLKFLLECSGMQNDNPDSVIAQAAHSINFICVKDYLAEIIKPYLVDIVRGLTTVLMTTKAERLFDVLYSVVTSFQVELLTDPENLLLLVSELVKRSQYEYEIIKADAQKPKIILNKSWNVIRAIGEEPLYVMNLHMELEKILEPMFDYLEKDPKIDFDEDLLNYISSTTKILKQVTPAVWRALKSFPKIFKQYEEMLANLFPALNYIIIYGWNTINEDPSIINVLINMGTHALDPANEIADEANHCEGALLLQLVVQYLTPITPENYAEIFHACHLCYENSQRGFLKAKLGGVYLCAFIKDFEKTQEILAKIELLPFVLTLILDKVTLFEIHAYDRKVLILGLCSILRQTNLHPEIEARFQDIFNVVISLLKYVGHMEQDQADKYARLKHGDQELKTSNQMLLKEFLDQKEKPKKPKTIDDGTDDEEEDDDDDEYDDSPYCDYTVERSEAATVVKYFETELKDKDEFDFFKESVLILRDARQDVIQKMVMDLPEKKVAFLKEVLQSKRISTDIEGRQQARKVVKTGGRKIAKVEFVDGNFKYNVNGEREPDNTQQ